MLTQTHTHTDFDTFELKKSFLFYELYNIKVLILENAKISNTYLLVSN